MEVLGIGPLEALFILVLALLVVGPRDLGKAARSFGRFLNRLYRSEAWSAITQASRNLRGLPNRLAREAALEELDGARAELREAGQGLGRDLDRLGRSLTSARPSGAPSPARPEPGAETKDPDAPSPAQPESSAEGENFGAAAEGSDSTPPSDRPSPG